MARPKQHVRCSQGSWSEVKENETEEEEMALCLYECLRAVGLQRYYARFTSVGVRRPAHLSALTMEDYPILGIRSMEDRTRLFHLIRMVKTLDEDFDISVGNISFNSDACEDPYEDVYGEEEEDVAAVSKLDSARFSKPSSVRRRLDFSCETSDRHQKGTVRIYASHTRNNQPGRGKGSNLPAEFELGPGSSAVCGCKENNHSVHSHQPDHHTRANSKPGSMGGFSLYNSLMRLSPKCVSPHKPKPKSTTVPSKRFSSKPVRHKDRKGISRKEKLFADISSNRTSEHMTKPTPVYESNRTAGYNYGLPLSSPPAPNKKQPGGQRISVCVRKRPLTCTEGRQGEADVVTTPSEECVIVHECKEAVDLTQYILQHRFYFDQVFGEESSNEEVYRRTAYPLVQHMLKGGKATCFAYGQTGAGKTHTMLGSSPGRPGLYALAVRDIFAHLSTTHIRTSLLVYVSFFEIYCGQLYDLLDHRKRLFAREDGQKVVHIAGLRDVRVDSVGSLLEVISQGTEERTQGMSGVNPLSSRSHALLQIQLRDPNQQIAGRMWFVDLAGSERASDTKEPDRQSRMEGAEINQSLLALKECIRSLDQEQLHTPFRQSKLTQVLKDSFVGDSMTCMIANISPGHLATENTLNTLRYADRVKELRGQGGPRGGRRGKTIPSPKRNLSNSSSSGGARGKSPPKKPKLGRRREAFVSTTPPSRSTTGGTILCSTPKDSRWGEGTRAIARKGLGLEYITPIQGLLGMDVENDRRERASGRESRRRERHGGTDRAGHSAGDQNVRSVKLFSRQAADEQLDLWEGRRESGFFQRKTENQQSNLKEGREEERRRRRQVESGRDTCGEVERETDLPKVDEKLKERERHLRQYHQQLQQFMPSSASSSVHLFSAASFPSSNQASPSSSASPSSCSSLQHSSSLSVSALMHHGLEEVLDAYRAKADGNREQLSFVTSEEICLPSETSPSHSMNNDEVGHGDSGSTDEDWRVSLEGTEASFGQDRGQSEDRGSLRATAERDVRGRSEDLRSAGMAGGGRRWAWEATTSTEEAGRMAGARPADAETPVSYSCHSDERGAVGEEGLDASDVPAAGVWSNEEREGAGSLVSTHHNNESSLFNHLPVDSVHQRAQAERPLSPACEHTDTLLSPNKLNGLPLELKHTRCTSNIHTLAFQNAQQCVPPSSRVEKGPQFAANKTEVSKSQSATVPDTTPVTQNGCKISAEPRNVSENSAYTQVEIDPEITSKIFVSPQEDTSLSDVMDPLSISLLQVDQQVATASFLQGEQNDTSLCLLEIENGEDSRREVEKKHPTCAEAARTVVEDEDVELHLSLLELPQIKNYCHPTFDAMTATNHTERGKDTCRAIYEQLTIGMVKPPIPGIMLVSLQDQENNQKPSKTPAIEVLGSKAPASLLKPSTCASVQTSVQSISSSVHLSVNTDSPISRSLMTNGATQLPSENAHKLAFSISNPQPESVLSQLNTLPKQGHRVHSNYSSNFSLQPNRPKETYGQECTSIQQNSSIIDLSTLEDLDPDQWRVVQAHWKQLEEMEALCCKEGMLLCQQPDMTFGEYVHKLEEIMERKARCVHGMIAQLQPYLTHSRSNPPHN